MESCKNCPSFLSEDKVPAVFGKVTGAPMCARYGYVLGRPGLSGVGNEKLWTAFALQCDSYGAAALDKPIDFRMRVVNPDPTAFAMVADPTFTASDLSTCRQCSNLVRADVVASEIGYAVDLCRAKGKLVTRPQFECRGCEMAVSGPMSTTTSGLEIRAEYREGYTVPVKAAVDKVIGHSNSTSEPTTYPTDAPVSDDDVALGIRAWRKVTDPHGSGNEVYMPIFDPDHFTPDQRALIPQTGDDEHPELYVDYAGICYSFAVEALCLEEVLCLQGPPGVGKTEFARWVAWLMQLPFRRFSFTSSTEVDDMIGKMMYDPERGTYFQWGRIPLAYAEDGIIVYDELNLAEPPIREALRSTFDNSKQLVLDAGTGERVTRGRFTFPIIAQNDSYDIRNVGTVEMADADYNRLSVVHVELPPDSVERHIIIERCKLDGYNILPETLDLLMSVGEDIREASAQQTIPFTWGIRQSIKVARKTRWYNLVDSFKRAALDFYDPETTKIVIDAIETRMA